MKACRKIIPYILLGIVLNVLVAWALSLSVDLSSNRMNGKSAFSPIDFNNRVSGEYLLNPPRYGTWHVEIFRTLGSMQVHSVQYRDDRGSLAPPIENPFDLYPQSLGFEAPVPLKVTLRPVENNVATTKKIYEARGWPFMSMCCIVHDSEYDFNFRPKDNMPRKRVSWSGGIVISWNGWPYTMARFEAVPPTALPKVLPLKPMPLGFIANTLFYGVIAAIVSTMIRRVRHWYLRRNSRCIACGYILSGITSSRCPECGNSK